MSTQGLNPPTSVSVAPTSTTLATFDVTATGTLTVQVANTDAVQTLACIVQRRATTANDFVDTTVPDLASIGPLASACVDLDIAANSDIRIIGTASGAGLTATISGRDRPRVR